jgi:hypothetical protein
MKDETGGYESALGRFARDKRLARLARFVRARPGDHCDACGSTLPRLLFGLKDAQTERCYFVGQNCLNWLLEAGLIARARFRHSSEIAYDREMKLRREDEPSPSTDGRENTARSSAVATPPMPVRPAIGAVDHSRVGRWVRQNGALILEAPRTNLDRMLIIIAISRLSRPTNDAVGYDG